MINNLVSIGDLNLEQIWQILNTAREFRNPETGKPNKYSALSGRTVVNLFFEDSTRTRISFETAAKKLGADLINFSAKGSSVSKGESLKDTAQTLLALGGDLVVMRHWASGAAHRLANSNWINAKIINAGDGTHEHPTQALLDAFTICDSKMLWEEKSFSGLQVAIVGDILHSRVARSNILLLQKLGAQVTVVAPSTLLPLGIEEWGVKVSHQLSPVLNQVDVIMELRIQQERMDGAFFPNPREFSRNYGLNFDRLQMLKKDSLILHPGPMNRGLEIDARSADSSNSKVLNQVSNGVLVRMAVLYLLETGWPKLLSNTNNKLGNEVA